MRLWFCWNDASVGLQVKLYDPTTREFLHRWNAIETMMRDRMRLAAGIQTQAIIVRRFKSDPEHKSANLVVIAPASHKKKWSPGIAVSKTANLFRIGWTVIEKSRPERDQNFTRLCDLLLIGSSLWRHFRYRCKDYRVLPCVKFWRR